MIETLQRNQAALEQLQSDQQLDQNQSRMSALRDSLQKSNQRINELIGQLQQYRNEVEKQDAIIRDVTRRVELTDEARYLTVRNNLENMMTVFELLNEKLNTLNAISQVDNYRTTLASLSNPADESLGFSYNKKVLQLLNEKINPRKDKARMIQIAESILSSSAVMTIAQNTPVLNIGATLLGFISNIAATDKNVEPLHIFEFKQELDKYTQYYVALHETNANLQLNLNEFQIQTRQLHAKLEEFVVKALKEGQFRAEARDYNRYPTEGEYLAVVFRTYNREYISRHLRDLEARNKAKNGKPDHGKILKSHSQIIDMSKYAGEVAYLFKQFDYLYSKYVAILEKNNQDMIALLEHAKKTNLSDDNTKIDRKITLIQEQKQEAVRSIRTAINIEKISSTIDRLDLFYISGGF
ncbi:MAG: hypothetical protein ACFCUI_05915 [Bernardetiaceae bacterium]